MFQVKGIMYVQVQQFCFQCPTTQAAALLPVYVIDMAVKAKCSYCSGIFGCDLRPNSEYFLIT